MNGQELVYPTITEKVVIIGACSVASYRKNTTSGNCLHFYCRPLSKCKFHPDEQIDSFSFSSNPTPSPSKPPLSTVDLKNDNTTVKPRKGVDDDFTKSGIKPRKGVSLDDDLPLSEFPPLGGKSKARKGVEAPPSSTSSAVIVSSMMTTTSNNNDDLMDLAMILADDSTTTTTTVEPSTVTPTPSSTTVVVPTTSTTPTTTSISSLTDFDVSTTTRNTVQSSTTTRTPPLMTTSVFETVPPSGEIEAKHLVASTIDKEEEEENDRRYTSSMHLVLSLVFGLLVLVAVLGVVAKRIYDGWLRRDYYRMNYLIDGIYNGVE